MVSTLASPFLTGQTRKVKLENGLSSRSGIKCGVSQGGQLSALLFTLYTDEIKLTIMSQSQNMLTILHYFAKSQKTLLIKIMSYQLSVNSKVSVCDRKNLLFSSKISKEMCFANVNIRLERL